MKARKPILWNYIMGDTILSSTTYTLYPYYCRHINELKLRILIYAIIYRPDETIVYNRYWMWCHPWFFS